MSLAITSVGLTIGGWFYSDLAHDYDPLINKGAGAAAYSYHLIGYSSIPYFRVSTDGTNLVDAASTVNYDHGVWFFCAGRWNPSTEVAVWVNDTKTANTVGVPATLYDTAEVFKIGELSGVYFDGKASMCWVCARALDDNIVTAIYESQRPLFGWDMEG